MKEKSNTVIEIQGKEFVVSSDANNVLSRHIQTVSRTYRFNPRAKKELLTALRDLLLELPASKQKTISAKTAESIIHMAGSTLDDESRLQPIKNTAGKSVQLFLRNFRKHVLTEKVRRNIFYALSVTMLIPIGFNIGSLEVFSPQYILYEDNTSITETTLGPVKEHDRSLDKTTTNEIDSYWPRQYSTLFLTIVAAVLSVLFYLLAVRSSKVKLVGAILVVAVVSSITVTNNETRGLDLAMSVWSTNSRVHNIPTSPRTETSLDTLYACGADIRYVYIDNYDGIFYTLRDAGYSLRDEIAGGIEPKREDLCKKYDALRKELPNERIVLMSYVKDTDGTIRPYDNTATFDQLTISKELAKQRFGFFVKEEE